MPTIPVTFDIDELAERLDQAANAADIADSDSIAIDRGTWVMARSLIDSYKKAVTAFTDEHLAIIRFCSIECALQLDTCQSVGRMTEAWDYAQTRAARRPSEEDVLALAAILVPGKNLNGYRQVDVQVGSGWEADVKGPWEHVPRQMASLCSDAAFDALTPAEWFRQFEETHPFRDGNGRAGQILFNWMSGTLAAPAWAPDFWDDHRRTPGFGAPS